MLLRCCFAAALLLFCCCGVVLVPLCCCFAAALLLLCCCRAAAVLLPSCCFVAALLLLYCCFIAALLLLKLFLLCCCFVAALLLPAAALLPFAIHCTTQVSRPVAALWQSSSVDLVHEPQAMKSVQAHLCKLWSLSFVVAAVLSSGTEGRASKPNATTFSVLSFARIADCNKYAKNSRNAEPEATMFTCSCRQRFYIP